MCVRVLQRACRPKLDKTGITLIDEIIIAKAPTLSGSLRGISAVADCAQRPHQRVRRPST